MTDAPLEWLRALTHFDPAQAVVPWWCDRDVCDGEPHGRWTQKHARSSQRPPGGDWRVFYLCGGRGSGKTLGAAHAFADMIEHNMGGQSEWAIVAPTFADARDTCMEGPSGLLNVLDPKLVRRGKVSDGWNRSMGQLHLADGGRVFCDGADDGGLRLQGKNLRGAWCDEVGLWAGSRASATGRRGVRVPWEQTWDESLAPAIRLEPARIVVSGTPKAGHGLVKRLLNDPDPHVVVSRLRTRDNFSNLSEAAISALLKRYEGTRLGRQELEGELIDDVEGALWQWSMIDHATDPPRSFERVVVAVDPSATKTGDECGIVAAASGWCSCLGPAERHFFVLRDESFRASPAEWAERVCGLFGDLAADRVVVERSFGEMCVQILRSVNSVLPVSEVTARRSKQARAEPVAALYEQGRVHHVGVFELLEAQLCGWEPDSGMPSPDRLDALVYAVSELAKVDADGWPDLAAFSPVGLGRSSPWRVG